MYLSIELPNIGFACLDELVSNSFCAEDVIGRQAGLPGVDTLAPRNPPSSHFNIGIVSHNSRARGREGGWA